VLVRLFKDDPTHPGQAILHLFCGQCHTPVVDVAVVEPIETLTRCQHHAPLDWGYHQGEVLIGCRRCNRVHLRVSPAMAPRGWMFSGHTEAP
jgi:hypothetical protein